VLKKCMLSCVLVVGGKEKTVLTPVVGAADSGPIVQGERGGGGK